MRFLILLPLALLGPALHSAPAAAPEAMLEAIYTETLTRSPAYDQLADLVTRFPGRLAGSQALEEAVIWSESRLKELGLDRVYTQEVRVPHWERGAPESVRLLPATGKETAALALNALALGGTVATPPGGITAEVVEVKSVDELEALGHAKLAGKIVFFNRPMDPAVINPSKAYGGAVDQRSRGPRTAARFGAVAALVRSMTHALDDAPHTGNTAYSPEGGNIPAAALSTLAADRLSAALAQDPSRKIEITLHARWHPEAISHNVIGEIRGSELPDEIIVVGGHLDSWDITPGAHDDGAGVVQSIEVLRIFRALGYQPRRTLRCVLFTNEENGLRGALAYADHARRNGEKHVFAVESDSGGFAPRGFSLGSTQGPVHEQAARWLPLFGPYGIHAFVRGAGGADVGPLMVLGATVGNLLPDSQRYFDYHHTAADTLDKVNARELHLGSGALAALIWLMDQEGL